MAQARFEISDYSSRVLDVVKGKFGLTNRNEALNKLIMKVGDQFIEPEFTEKEVHAIRGTVAEYEGKKVKKSMTLNELDKILNLK